MKYPLRGEFVVDRSFTINQPQIGTGGSRIRSFQSNKHYLRNHILMGQMGLGGYLLFFATLRQSGTPETASG